MAPLYREFEPPPDLAAHVACTWERRLDEATPPPILPDGCMDVVVLPDGRTIVAGTDTAPVTVQTGVGTAVGIRFRVGRAAPILGVPASELRDRRVLLEDVWSLEGRRVATRLEAAESPADRRMVLERAVAVRSGAVAADRLVDAAVTRLEREGRASVSSLASELAIGERQLLRRFQAAVGYGPKTLQRVLRMRRLLRALGRGDDVDLAWLALELGYADQAHMTRECVALTGRPPGALRA